MNPFQTYLTVSAENDQGPMTTTQERSLRTPFFYALLYENLF